MKVSQSIQYLYIGSCYFLVKVSHGSYLTTNQHFSSYSVVSFCFSMQSIQNEQFSGSLVIVGSCHSNFLLQIIHLSLSSMLPVTIYEIFFVLALFALLYFSSVYPVAFRTSGVFFHIYFIDRDIFFSYYFVVFYWPTFNNGRGAEPYICVGSWPFHFLAASSCASA